MRVADEMLRNVGVALVRTKLGKCGACGCETQFNENPVGSKRKRTNLCAACYRAKAIRDMANSIRCSRNQLANLMKCEKALGWQKLTEPIAVFGKALNKALESLEVST